VSCDDEDELACSSSDRLLRLKVSPVELLITLEVVELLLLMLGVIYYISTKCVAQFLVASLFDGGFHVS